MSYLQFTSDERYKLAALLWQRYSYADIGRQLGRDRSTIMRSPARGETSVLYKMAPISQKTCDQR